MFSLIKVPLVLFLLVLLFTRVVNSLSTQSDDHLDEYDDE